VKINAPARLINRLDAKNIENSYVDFTSDGHVWTRLYRCGKDEGEPVRNESRMVTGMYDFGGNQQGQIRSD
jgi:hypothetical protein